MREWLVIEDSRKHSIFAPDDLKPVGYIPRDVAECLLGDLDGKVWFTREEGERMRQDPEWRTSEPTWSALGFWL